MDEALLTCPLLTSFCMAQFLTGHGLVLVHALEVGDPGIEYLLCFTDVNEEGAPLWGIAF